MISISNIRQWFKEVIEITKEKELDPSDSIFALLFFSSMDFDLVEFFRAHRIQISQYSGQSFHLITPIIFENAIVPDDELRILREEFRESGIPIGHRPSAVLFKLRKRPAATGYEPRFLAAYEFPNFGKIAESFTEFIDICIEHRSDQPRLIRELTIFFRQPNLIQHVAEKTPFSQSPIESVLQAPRVFISYTHRDSEAVEKIYSQLKSQHIILWLDKFEVFPGMQIRDTVEDALKQSDALVTVLSRNAKDSDWMAFEGSLFYGYGKPIIPIVLDDEGRELAEKLPFLQGRHYVDLTDPPRKSNPLSGLFKVLGDLK